MTFRCQKIFCLLFTTVNRKGNCFRLEFGDLFSPDNNESIINRKMPNLQSKYSLSVLYSSLNKLFLCYQLNEIDASLIRLPWKCILSNCNSSFLASSLITATNLALYFLFLCSTPLGKEIIFSELIKLNLPIFSWSS